MMTFTLIYIVLIHDAIHFGFTHFSLYVCISCLNSCSDISLSFYHSSKIPLSSNFDLILSYLYPFLISDSIVFITNCCPSYLRLLLCIYFSRSFAINHLIYFHLVQNLIGYCLLYNIHRISFFELDFEVPFDVF